MTVLYRGTVALLASSAMLVPNSAVTQEQGQPRGLPPAADYAREVLYGGPKSQMVAISACPRESEWHRSLLAIVLAPERRTDALIRRLVTPSERFSGSATGHRLTSGYGTHSWGSRVILKWCRSSLP